MKSSDFTTPLPLTGCPATSPVPPLKGAGSFKLVSKYLKERKGRVEDEGDAGELQPCSSTAFAGSALSTNEAARSVCPRQLLRAGVLAACAGLSAWRRGKDVRKSCRG